MSENFKRGDIAIAQYFEEFPEYNGMQCEVLDPLEFRGIVRLSDMAVIENALRYRVKFPDGQVLGPRPHQLRKMPDADDQRAANDEVYEPVKAAA
jgi:hypothetical protein